MPGSRRYTANSSSSSRSRCTSYYSDEENTNHTGSDGVAGIGGVPRTGPAAPCQCGGCITEGQQRGAKQVCQNCDHFTETEAPSIMVSGQSADRCTPGHMGCGADTLHEGEVQSGVLDVCSGRESCTGDSVRRGRPGSSLRIEDAVMVAFPAWGMAK